MQVQKIFIITPLGNKNSEARKHADRMWNEVFVPVSEKISTNDLKVEFELVLCQDLVQVKMRNFSPF